MRSYLAVPLFIQDELVGTLNLESTRARAFTPDHITIAIELAASLAVAIRQARLYERAQQEITERMQAESTLRISNRELEARNAELDAFAHTVAHDLKNPVTSIVGYADVLSKNRETLPDDMQDQFLLVIGRNSHKLASIIDELLLLASVRGKEEIELHPLEMGRIVAEARGRLLHLIEEHRGEISLPETWPVALGYAPWVEAIWTNYLSNALKYGGRPPQVELGAKVEEAGWVRFWVRDNGPGLSPEEQDRLFTPFERLHQARAEGHGLGLSIVQRIAMKLGGQVGVESDNVPGQGCIFYFTLPALSKASNGDHEKRETDTLA
jgi:signal transduction histidine kinase